MLGLSNRVVYGIAVLVALIAAIFIGWNLWRTWSAPAPTSSAAVPTEATAQAQSQTQLQAKPDAAKLDAAKPETPAGKPAANGPKPQFDVVRVEPSGETVVAGRAAPNAKITLFSAGKPVGEVTANGEGQFVILPPALPPGDHLLSLQADAVTSDQTVAIAVPKPGSRDVVVALAEPDKPTRILSDAKPAAAKAEAAPAASSAAPANAAPQNAASASPPVAIRAVEAQEGGGFFLSGLATAGAQVRLYLNGALIASAQAGPDGRWSVRVEKGMSSGKYAVRADVLGQDGGVVARAEVPFDYPAAGTMAATSGKRDAASPASESTAQRQAEAATPATTAAGPEKRSDAAAAAPQSTVVAELRTARVERGDSLWRISRTMLGHGVRYTQIYDANTDQIRDPDLIYPGQVLVVPNPTP
ncbi:MAG: hypothetical protein BGP04_08640 [Rhizobiales bacterium 62-17]|nr:LysM peptidoglycan-binding domain-containing protein [Hyphomicrobiales bacterium]OJY05442.1 MAG: hypothetical protein BGP04_08640 [Rhizobiales bacterium 62-17]